MPGSRVAVVLALIVLLPGCLSSETYEGLWEDLEAKDRFETRVLFNETIEFSASGVSDSDDPLGPVTGGADQAGDRWNTTITVPNGTRQLTTVFTIAFETSDAQEPMPTNPPDGDIRVYVRGAGNESQNLTVEEPIRAGFDFPDPTEGEWTLGFVARGQGNVSWDVTALAPVQDNQAS